jgi:transcriptional regulator with XRE-family HTH domain
MAESISNRLRKWRKRRKLTQIEAAELIGAPVKTYIDWEHGRHAPRGLALESVLKKTAR